MQSARTFVRRFLTIASITWGFFALLMYRDFGRVLLSPTMTGNIAHADAPNSPACVADPACVTNPGSGDSGNGCGACGCAGTGDGCNGSDCGAGTDSGCDSCGGGCDSK